MKTLSKTISKSLPLRGRFGGGLGLLLCLLLSTAAHAQRIDLDQNNANPTVVQEEGYDHWTTGRTTADISKDFLTDQGNTITITMGTGGVDNRCIRDNWWKQGCQQFSKLICDCFAVYGYDSDGNTPQLTDEDAELYMTISGMTPGRHTLLAYMNVTDGGIETVAPIDIYVDDKPALQDVQMTVRAETMYTSGQAYIIFDAQEGKDVRIRFQSKSQGKTWGTSGIFLNALIFDRPNPLTQCSDPLPENRDYHYNCDNGSATLQWTMAAKAVKNHVYVGTDKSDLKEVAVNDKGSYTITKVSNLETYFWRIDEEDAQGDVYEGDVWTFRPRHLAFPGAEGMGQFATGGRGGSVYHVTTLDDNGDDENPLPGSFRYGVKKATGPRTIVFDVSGTIYLKARLFCSDEYVTIAGQTAPGELLLRGAPFGIGSENQCRHLRMRRGFHNDDEQDYQRGLDGLGINGDHAIMDHCSISWTIDEAHSSRNSGTITFQNCFISEALNDAHHPNYSWGTCHGYAATIGGGSYHHNLLAHNEGRNWSMAGGLIGGAYAGQLDMFNNVCYNWGGRATDGGVHEGQFVNNYYIMGPATSQKYLLNAQIEGTGTGSQAYYVSGNIREEKSGSLTQNKLNETHKYSLSGGQKLDWEVFVSQPFFDSHATIDPARLAYKKVLSDCGANYLNCLLDEHDQRVIADVLRRTHTYTGSSTKKKGLIDRETDAEGYTELPVLRADTDADQDGMPDWWETIAGTNPTVADNNSDSDGDGYTALEDYLNFLAAPHIKTAPQATERLYKASLFQGFSKQPTVVSAPSEVSVAVVPVSEKSAYGIERQYYVEFKVSAACPPGIYSVTLSADDGDGNGSMQRTVAIAVTDDGTLGIADTNAASPHIRDTQPYNLAGQRVSPQYRGIIVKDNKKISQ